MTMSGVKSYEQGILVSGATTRELKGTIIDVGIKMFGETDELYGHLICTTFPNYKLSVNTDSLFRPLNSMRFYFDSLFAT